MLFVIETTGIETYFSRYRNKVNKRYLPDTTYEILHAWNHVNLYFIFGDNSSLQHPVEKTIALLDCLTFLCMI
jgi:uncharacterized protein (DUF927 family)